MDDSHPKSMSEFLNDNELHNKIKENRFTLFSKNIRSLTKNLIELNFIAQKFEPDVLTVQEIWKPYGPFVTINNYHEIIMNPRRQGKNGGGTAIYVHKRNKYKKVNKFEQLKLKVVEVTAVEMISNKFEVLIISIYRPPKSDMGDTFHDFEKIFSKIGDQSVIISGDTNINYAKHNRLKEIFNQKLLENGLFQTVKQFTRITKKSKTIIDHSITNINTLTSFVSDIAIADHQLVASFWGGNPNSKKANNNETANKINETIHFSQTLANLEKINWNEWENVSHDLSVNELYESFNTKIQQSLAYEKNKSKKKKKSQPWYTKEIQNLKKQLDKKRKKFLKKSDEHNENEYKILKRNYNKELKTAKNNYYLNKIKNAKNDTKKIWTIINELLNRSKYNDKFDKIIHNNQEITDEYDIANTLSEFYKSAAFNKIKEIKSDRHFTEFLDYSKRKLDTFDLQQIDIYDTWNYIKTIRPKLSSGFDGFPSKLLNLAAPGLLKPLTFIINTCFKNGEFPKTLKISKIFPVPKDQQKPPNCSNFRPVNLLSSFSKVIEKAANSQFENYLNSNFSNKFQFAYKKNHGTVHAILLTRHIAEIELSKKNYVLLIMIDLSLAFDTVCTSEILPAKLEFYGATSKTINFYKNFFNERKHFIQWHKTNSEPINLFNYSCVQGSTIAAPTFNFYTQDLENVINSNLISFADDTNIVLSDKNPNDLIRKGNIELKKIKQYMAANNLIVNENKSSFILMKPKGVKSVNVTEKLRMENTEIKRVTEARYLGVILDEKLNFKKQYESVVKKLENTVKALICTRNSLNFKAKYQLYNALFESHVNYCSIAYMDKLNKTQLEKLKKLQKKAVRLIFNARKTSHTKELFKLSKITPIEYLYRNEVIKFVHRNVSETSASDQPEAIKDILFQNPNTCTIELRSNDDTTKIKIKSEFKKGQCFYNILDTWNNSESDLRNAGNLFSLKKMLKNKVDSEWKDCSINDCYSCNIDKNRDFSHYMKI